MEGHRCLLQGQNIPTGLPEQPARVQVLEASAWATSVTSVLRAPAVRRLLVLVGFHPSSKGHCARDELMEERI